MTIKIIELTDSPLAVSAIDGEAIYTKIETALNNNESVILDFEGIELTITAFLNACIGKLYANFDVSKIKASLSIQNLNSDELPLLKFVIDEAKKRFGKDQPKNDLLDETFD